MKRNYFKGLLAALTLFGLGTSQAWADKIVTSTAENPKWFRIYTPNRSNLSLISKGVGVAMQNTKTFENPTRPANCGALRQAVPMAPTKLLTCRVSISRHRQR